jgi:hypothetical protein
MCVACQRFEHLMILFMPGYSDSGKLDTDGYRAYQALVEP